MILGYVIFISIVSAQLTHLLVKRYHWSSVRTSALTSLIFAVTMKLTGVQNGDTLSAAFLGASFLGMANTEVFTERDLFFGAWIFSLIFHFVLPLNIGLGGALGTAAFITCGLIRGSGLLAKRLRSSSLRRKTIRLPQENIQTSPSSLE